MAAQREPVALIDGIGTATRSDDYHVFLRSHGRPIVWSWEIQRRSRPMGVRVYGDGFSNEFAAKPAEESHCASF
jgi:hypothetical protein